MIMVAKRKIFRLERDSMQISFLEPAFSSTEPNSRLLEADSNSVDSLFRFPAAILCFAFPDSGTCVFWPKYVCNADPTMSGKSDGNHSLGDMEKLNISLAGEAFP